MKNVKKNWKIICNKNVILNTVEKKMKEDKQAKNYNRKKYTIKIIIIKKTNYTWTLCTQKELSKWNGLS